MSFPYAFYRNIFNKLKTVLFQKFILSLNLKPYLGQMNWLASS